ncbi:kinase-like protein [Pluteus cervinus]|uniref:Kinase-like protein n=1 Tax=Pluteus cervinus TaxID=181527 RepID=A0ACD3B313_9AGAR|nr:kinase-like protein [Pluteus cervinus]
MLTSLLDSLWNVICSQARRFLLPYLLRRSKRNYPSISHNINRLTDNTVIKSSTIDKLRLEADALRFIAQHTSIPVPHVYDVWITDPKTNTGYLAMEYIPGEMVGRVWRKLSPEQRASFMRKLGQYLDEMRSLRQPLPGGWIGSLTAGPSYDRFAAPSSMYGPFANETSYNDWRISRTKRAASESEKAALRLAELRREMPDDHRISFTHGDISNRNILVRVTGEGPDDIDIVAILDWEQAGWRPEYWEMFKIRFVMSGHEFSTLARQLIFPGYETELELESEMIQISGLPI